tara:strand:+ start:2043 stop:3041 length:999 start_codon:yes stop_codon:yes gene_type:complete
MPEEEYVEEPEENEQDGGVQQFLEDNSESESEEYEEGDEEEETEEDSEPLLVDEAETEEDEGGDEEEGVPENAERDEKLYAGFQEISRRESDMVKKEKDFKDKVKSIDDIESKYNEFQNSLKLLNSDPEGFLQKYGSSYDDITDTILKGPKAAPVEENAVVKDMKNELESLKARIAQDDAFKKQEQVNNNLSNYIDDVKNEAVAGKEEYGYVLENWDEAKETFLQIQTEYAHQTQTKYGTARILETENVLRDIETYYESLVERLINTDKFKSIIGEEIPESKQSRKPAQSKGKTLSNKQKKQAPHREPEDANISDEDRLDKAVRIMRGDKIA